MIKQGSKRTNQGGSILTFIIVAAVLGLALVGSVMFIRHKGEVAQSQTPIFGPVTAPTTENDKNTDTGSSSQSGEKPASSEAGRDTGTTSESQAGAPAGELPKTGPANTLSAALIVGLVAMVAVSYARSRHLSWQV